MAKIMSKRARKAAKKLFPKVKHNTRPFTSEDYKRLPKNHEIPKETL